MRLERNIPENQGRQKYALVNMRKLNASADPVDGVRYDIQFALRCLEENGLIEYGNTLEDEFFAIKLKDSNAGYALAAYAIGARAHDPEYADDVLELADRSGHYHPLCKFPD